MIERFEFGEIEGEYSRRFRAAQSQWLCRQGHQLWRAADRVPHARPRRANSPISSSASMISPPTSPPILISVRPAGAMATASRMAGSNWTARPARWIATKVRTICMAAAMALTARTGQPLPTRRRTPLSSPWFRRMASRGFRARCISAPPIASRDDNVLDIRMRGLTDKPTILNAVHHTYWNLAGQGRATCETRA